MTRYTIRDAATLAPLAVYDDLRDAVDALAIEELAWRLNPPSGSHTLQLVVTADGQDHAAAAAIEEAGADGGVGPVGDVVVLYAAGGGSVTAATAVTGP